jgi:hypothetical protein
MFFYLAMPSQLFVMMAAAALVVRLPVEYEGDR